VQNIIFYDKSVHVCFEKKYWSAVKGGGMLEDTGFLEYLIRVV
jgi:hypothetical protein